MRAIVMWFDPPTEECVLSLWAALDGVEMGLGIELPAVSLFPPAVLHLTVTPTRQLLALQSSVVARLGAAVRGLDQFYAVPGRWQPHCTLATDVPVALTAEAMRVARDLLPVRGTVEWLGVEEAGSHRRWAIPPATPLP